MQGMHGSGLRRCKHEFSNSRIALARSRSRVLRLNGFVQFSQEAGVEEPFPSELQGLGGVRKELSGCAWILCHGGCVVGEPSRRVARSPRVSIISGVTS